MSEMLRIIPTVKLGDKKRLDCEQPSNSKPFSVTKLPVYFTNSEQPCVSEQFCNDQKVPCLFVTEEILITVSQRAPERKLGQAPITIVPNS